MRLVAIFMGLAIAVASATGAGAQETSHDQLAARMTAWTRLPRRAIVSVNPGVMVAIVHSGVRAKSGDIVEGVVLQSEAADETAAQASGWRSMRSEIDVSCATRSNRFRRVMLYSGHNLAGAPRVHTPPSGWIHPTAKAYMVDVIASVCGPERPGGAPMTVAQQTPPPEGSSAPPINFAPAAQPRHTGSLVGVDLPEADAPMPTRQAVATAAPPPAPQPQPSAPSFAPRPAPSQLVAAAPASRRPGVGVVQIAAFPSAAAAEQALSAFAQTPAGQTAGLSRRIETARVKGAIYYRAVIAGFGSTEEASALCAAIKRGGGDCFVRP